MLQVSNPTTDCKRAHLPCLGTHRFGSSRRGCGGRSTSASTADPWSTLRGRGVTRGHRNRHRCSGSSPMGASRLRRPPGHAVPAARHARVYRGVPHRCRLSYRGAADTRGGCHLTDVGPSNLRDGGLQSERTALAWTRTSFAVLANGALPMLKAFHGFNGSLQPIVVGLAAAIALSTHLLGRRRQRLLGRQPLPQRLTARYAVHLLGISVLVLIATSALASLSC
jgi:uncharacterized membrane protein YidH (DUF202 family)